MTTASCDESMKAGTAVTCRLEAYDNEGQLVNIPALAAAFHVRIEGTTEISTGTHYNVEYTGPGEFTATVLATRAGELKTTFMYHCKSYESEMINLDVILLR